MAISSSVQTAPPAIDVAERGAFTQIGDSVPSFDPRDAATLQEAARWHDDRVERERAMWELAMRRRDGVIGFLADAMRCEPDPAVRWGQLWLATKVGDAEALPVLDRALADGHREVRDWARVLLNDCVGAGLPPEYADGVYTPDGSFDQTLPLQIAGFAVVKLPDGHVLRATLSPLWFERIMGRVLACTNLETIMTDLTVEKELEGYHSDGTNHYEIFQFGGLSWVGDDERINHRYQSDMERTFYLSGKVEDHSKGVERIPVILNRGATTSASALSVKSSGSSGRRQTRRQASDAPVLDARGVRLMNGRVVDTVRGEFFGWGATSIEHFVAAGEILAGTVQLANPTHPATAEYVNTYLCGSFRGKISDLDGDGRVDVNLIPCHGNERGEIDYYADGTMRPDPFE